MRAEVLLGSATLIVVLAHALFAWKTRHDTRRMADNIDKVTPGSDG